MCLKTPNVNAKATRAEDSLAANCSKLYKRAIRHASTVLRAMLVLKRKDECKRMSEWQ